MLIKRVTMFLVQILFLLEMFFSLVIITSRTMEYETFWRA